MNEKAPLNKVLECCAFFGIACIAIALIFAVCFQGTTIIYNIFKTIGDAVAYILAIALAGFYVKGKTHKAWLVLYIIFVVVIVVFYILGLVKIV